VVRGTWGTWVHEPPLPRAHGFVRLDTGRVGRRTFAALGHHRRREDNLRERGLGRHNRGQLAHERIQKGQRSTRAQGECGEGGVCEQE